MACMQHLLNLKCATEVETRAILAEIGEYPGCQVLVSCLDLLAMARDLIPDDAHANLLPVAVGTDGNCLHRAISLLFAGHVD